MHFRKTTLVNIEEFGERKTSGRKASYDIVVRALVTDDEAHPSGDKYHRLSGAHMTRVLEH